MSIESIPADEVPAAGAAQEGIWPRRLVYFLYVLKNVFLVHKGFVTECTFFRFAFTTDFNMTGEVNTMRVTSPAGGTLIGLDPIVLVHVTFKLDLVPEASITNFTLK